MRYEQSFSKANNQPQMQMPIRRQACKKHPEQGNGPDCSEERDWGERL